VTRARLAAFGYAYVAFALPAFIVGFHHSSLQSALFAGAAFAFLWFLASLRARLDRYDPEGFFASVVVLSGAAFIALQTLTLLATAPQAAAPTAACAATVVIGSSLAALRARKVTKWFGYAGVAGGIAVLTVGIVEGAAHWRLAGNDVFASALGFMIWVVVTATYLLRR
jgi:FtsH-binding integral membrane protein